MLRRHPSEHRAAGEGRPGRLGYTPSEGRVCDESEPQGTDPAPSLREVRGENQMMGTQEEGPTEHGCRLPRRELDVSRLRQQE